MIFIIPEREILKAVTDSNITSEASKLRVKAFSETHNLIGYRSKPVVMVIEGNLYEIVSHRLTDNHKLVFQDNYEIENSALGTPKYNVTLGIKFIVKEKKLPIRRNRVIILTENTSSYAEYEQNQHPRVRVFNSKDFLKKIDRFQAIKDNYNDVDDALVTAFFVD